MSATAGLKPFFTPRSVAVVGASSRPESVGYAIFRNLLFGGGIGAAPLKGVTKKFATSGDTSSAEGFEGNVYPINHKGGEILGRPVYKSLAAVGEPIDLLVIAIPGKYIPAVVDEAGGLGIKAVIVISAGFSEVGEEGHALEVELVKTAKKHGIRMIGPNCLGVIRPSSRLNASFSAASPPRGSIGLLSQSGALITGIISYCQQERFGLSAAVSLGDKADVADVEILNYLAEDDETKAIAMYAEALPQPRAFFEAAQRISLKKPIVALKGGSTEAGAKAASSHTGSLAGSSAAYTAAFAQSGILQASKIGDFMAWSRALSSQPPARGNRLAIITNAGGPGVLSADEASRHGIELAQLSEETISKLNEVLPSVWSHNNPIDIIGDATAERYRDALKIVGQAPEIDGVVVIMTVQAMTDPSATAMAVDQAQEGADWNIPIVGSFLGLAGTTVGSYLDAQGIPEFDTPEQAISAMGALMRRGAWLDRQPAVAKEFPGMPAPDLARSRATLAKAKEAGQSNLDLALATEVLNAAGLRYNRSSTAKDVDEAVKMGAEIGYPVVIKLLSPDVVHKSDVGGVVLDVVGEEGVREACASINERIEHHHPGARITGYTVEEQIGGTEIIVGMFRDAGFGPLMMVGMGGVFVEVYKDVAFRLIPITRRDALDMIDEIKAQPLLNGARKRPVLDRDELAEVLMRVSALVEACPEIVELDVNPLVITADRGLVSIDARVIV